ncbi:MAG: PPC domain-containing DNA-binding protein, partial [Flavobacteriales bacterium]
YRVHIIRMLPNADVRAELERWCAAQGLEAAVIISAVGSLSTAVIRFGGRSEGATVTGDLEVCALSGTLSRHGLHVHIAVADGNGTMTGGHLLNGCLVRTTLELAVQEVGGIRLRREQDPRTGYAELLPEVIDP